MFRDLLVRLADGAVARSAGANGAGKTTLLRMLIGCLSPVGRRRPDRRLPTRVMPLLRTAVAYFAGAATLPLGVQGDGLGDAWQRRSGAAGSAPDSRAVAGQ